MTILCLVFWPILNFFFFNRFWSIIWANYFRYIFDQILKRQFNLSFIIFILQKLSFPMNLGILFNHDLHIPFLSFFFFMQCYHAALLPTFTIMHLYIIESQIIDICFWGFTYVFKAIFDFCP